MQEDSDEHIVAVANIMKQYGYLNVALFGLDNRSSGKYESGNSDCIMIASLNYDKIGRASCRERV